MDKSLPHTTGGSTMQTDRLFACPPKLRCVAIVIAVVAFQLSGVPLQAEDRLRQR